jgi:hypothetical protein
MNKYPCIDCCSNIRPRQEALQCDQCSQWQHRLCNTSKTFFSNCIAVVYYLGTGYEYDGNVFVAWVLQVRRVEVVTKWSTCFRTWTPILRKLITHLEATNMTDFCFLKYIVFYFIKWQFMNFLYNFLFVVYIFITIQSDALKN